MDWFERLPAIARHTPWQTYPGHVPCPLQDSNSFDYQWTTPRSGLTSRSRAASNAAQLLISVLEPDFPDEFISRLKTGVLAARYGVGFQNCDYVRRIVDEFAAHSRTCGESA
jgi:asparagine synthase (glutamine-hydrolysing)